MPAATIQYNVFFFLIRICFFFFFFRSLLFSLLLFLLLLSHFSMYTNIQHLYNLFHLRYRSQYFVSLSFCFFILGRGLLLQQKDNIYISACIFLFLLGCLFHFVDKQIEGGLLFEMLNNGKKKQVHGNCSVELSSK